MYLREKSTIQRSKACLERFHRLSNLVNRVTRAPGVEPERVNVRIFLASYMIAVYPRNVFENMGVLETEVFNSAKALVEHFEEILLSGSFKSRTFADVLSKYLQDFKAWKVPDEAKLVARIKHALVALYQARSQLPLDEPVNSQLNTEFRTQIQRLREKLGQIAGPEELAAFDVGHPDDWAARAARMDNVAAQGRACVALVDRMTNEQLAHELLLDAAFKLTDRGTCCESDAARRVRESFHRAFWDSLADDLRMSPPCYVRVLRVLTEVRDGIIEVAPAREAARASEVLDMELIKQQADAGLWTWASCHALVESVVALLKRAQSPTRDVETASKWAELQAGMEVAADKPAALCRDLEFLLNRVNALRIDAANARLRLIAPVIRDHGVEYERGRFQDKLNNGTVTLEVTAVWLRTSSGTSPVDLLANALLRLVEDPPAVFPETLLLDAARIRTMHREFVHLSRSAALVVRSVPLVGGEIARIGAALAQQPSDMSQAIESVIAMTRQMQIAVEQSSDDNDRVCQLMRGRMRAALKEGRFTGIHSSIVEAVRALAVRFSHVLHVNRAVHGVNYDRILRGLV